MRISRYGIMVALFVLTGCGEEAPGTIEALCIPGSSHSCVCTTGASGAQMCNEEGTRFEPCICTDPGTVSDTHNSTSPSTDGSGTAPGNEDIHAAKSDAGDGITTVPPDVTDPNADAIATCDAGDLCACGDGICQEAAGENKDSCPSDCKACGDGVCSATENPANCSIDCCGATQPGTGSGCGDGVCSEGGEDCAWT